MLIKELKKILLKGESDTIEFKSNFNTQAIEALVAFANLKGGAVYIGVSDTGKITGILINPETIQIIYYLQAKFLTYTCKACSYHGIHIYTKMQQFIISILRKF